MLGLLGIRYNIADDKNENQICHNDNAFMISTCNFFAQNVYDNTLERPVLVGDFGSLVLRCVQVVLYIISVSAYHQILTHVFG